MYPTHTTIPRVNIKKENSYVKLRRPPIPREVDCEHESSLQWTMENLIKECVENQTAVEFTMMREALKPNPWKESWWCLTMLKERAKSARSLLVLK